MTEIEFTHYLKELEIEISEHQLDQLNRYYELLIKWNQKINLTTIIEKEDVYLKHFYDSATIFKVLPKDKNILLCDIGTGAGFPGIVLKILFPNIKIILIDSLNKRIKFLNVVIKELNLVNIKAIHSRIEEYATKNKEKFDIITARAVAHLSILLEYSIPMLKKDGYFIAMKGNIQDELKESENALKILNCKLKSQIEFQLPKEKGNRNLLKIQKINLCPGKYPRKYSDIKKNRL